MKNSLQELHSLAVKARKNSHSPYSSHAVGAAVLMDNGEIFTGCNIENASFGGTVCAERVAIWNAIAKLGKKKIKQVVVVTDAKEPWPPCGLCRQVISEFASAKTQVHTGNLKKIVHSFQFSELLPESFNPDFLK